MNKVSSCCRRCSGLLIVCLWLWSCAAPGFIPSGSEPLGTYRGALYGNVYDGPIEVGLFQAPDGQVLFTGKFTNDLGDYHFRGSVTGEELSGKISLGFGTITGRLSADKKRMSGDFRLAQNHGNWTALLQ